VDLEADLPRLSSSSSAPGAASDDAGLSTPLGSARVPLTAAPSEHELSPAEADAAAEGAHPQTEARRRRAASARELGARPSRWLRVDRAALYFVRCCCRVGLPENLPLAAQRQTSTLRCPLLACSCCGMLGLSLQLWCVLKGWILLGQNVKGDCEPLQHWLLGYSVALTMLPFCFAVAGPLVVWWVANGTIIRSGVPKSCEQEFPELWHFVDEVLGMSLATCACFLATSLLGCLVRRRADQLQRLWGSEGPVIEDVTNRILAVPPLQGVDPGTECSICLESGPSQERWRELLCRHVFHEHCLLEWLRRSRRCPLCRLDLQTAYLERSTEDVA